MWLKCVFISENLQPITYEFIITKLASKVDLFFMLTKVFYYIIICSDSPEVPNTIGVCVKPLHFTYNKTLELLQFIELNRILGVSRRAFHHQIFVHLVGPKTNQTSWCFCSDKRFSEILEIECSELTVVLGMQPNTARYIYCL